MYLYMKRQLFLVFISLCAGIWLGQYIDSLNAAVLFAIVAVVIPVMVGKGLGKDRVCVLLFPFILGAMLYMANATPPSYAVDKFADADKTIKVSGIVGAVNCYSESNTTCFVFKGSVFELDKEYAEKKIKIKAYYDGQVEPGDILVLKGKLESPKGRKNPSDFNRQWYMYAKKQYYTMNVEQIWRYGNKKTPYTIMHRLNKRVCDNFYKVLPEKEATLMCGMIMGDKDNIDDDVSNLYKRTGIYHVLAISGLHIGLLGAAVLWLLSFLGKTKSRLFTLLLMTIYCIMTGASVSVTRAVIMLYILIFSKFISREYDLISSASLTGCVLLCYSPFYLFDAGFLFSFAAVFAIGAVSDLGNIYRKYREVINTYGITIAADMATKPVTMYNFFYINPLSFLANLVLVPLMSICVGFGFVLAVMGLASEALARLVAMPVLCILKSVELLAELFTYMPCTYLVTGRPSLVLIFIYAVVLAGVYISIERGSFKKLKALCGCLVVVALCGVFGKNFDNGTYVSFLDVGQGECAVATVDNRVLMVDGGSISDNVGEYTILPYLLYRGINHIDGVFVSHTDKDHINGIIDIIGAIDIEEIYLPYGFEKDGKYKSLKEKADINNVKIKVVSEGTKINFGENACMEVLYPPKNLELTGNNGSMVARLQCDGDSVLFTGDVEADGEKFILTNNKAVKTDILKLAHHGSQSSNTEEMLRAVKPRCAVASADSTLYDHPSPSVLARLDKMGIPCYITEYTGEICFKFTKHGIRVETYCKEKADE